jgi:uncharacterized protein YkwD
VSLSLQRSRRAGIPVLAMAAFVLVPAASAAAACAGADIRQDGQSARQYAGAVQCLLNEQRAQAGLPPLVSDRRLTRAARRFSLAMVRRRFFDHVSPEGSTVGQRVRQAGFSGGALGETIAWGSGEQSTPGAIVSGWMGSPGHRAIILDGQFHRVGVGVAPGSPAGMGGATVTGDFAA